MDYVGVRTTPVDENKMPTQPGAINGGFMKRTEQVKGPVIAVQVDSVDTYLQLIASFPKKSYGKFMQLYRKFTLEPKKYSTSPAWHENSHFWTCECIFKTN